MTLDDIIKNRTMGVGDVKSQMGPEDVEMTEQFWEVIAIYHPHLLTWDSREFSNEQIRYLIMVLDRAIEDKVDTHSITRENKEEAERVREELLELL